MNSSINKKPSLVGLTEIFTKLKTSISTHCKEQGDLLQKIWDAYTSELASEYSLVLSQKEEEHLMLLRSASSLVEDCNEMSSLLKIKNKKIISVYNQYCHTSTILNSTLQLYKTNVEQKEEVTKKFDNFKESVEVFLPNISEYIDDITIRMPLYRVAENRAREAKFDCSHGYEVMTEKQKLYLYDIERQVESFPCKTSYAIRDEDQRRVYMELDSRIRSLNTTCGEQEIKIDRLMKQLSDQELLTKKYIDELEEQGKIYEQDKAKLK